MSGGEQRKKSGTKISVYATAGNLFLFGIYLFSGIAGHSIALISAGVDSLIDACSSLLLLMGFRISCRAEDSMHPHGHGRIEYIVGLLISEIILAASFSLAKESISRILHLGELTFVGLLLFTTALGAGIKLAICIYAKKMNKTLNSPAVEAYYRDAQMDAAGIIPIAAGVILQRFTTLPLDGMISLFLSVLIAADGVQNFAKNISLLIGEGISEQKEKQLSVLVNSYEEFEEMLSLTVDDYGPEKKTAALIVKANPRVSTQKIEEAVKKCAAVIQKDFGLEVSIYIQAEETLFADNKVLGRERENALRYMRKFAEERMNGFWKRRQRKRTVE